MKDSVLGNASFEKTPDHLFNASVRGSCGAAGVGAMLSSMRNPRLPSLAHPLSYPLSCLPACLPAARQGGLSRGCVCMHHYGFPDGAGNGQFQAVTQAARAQAAEKALAPPWELTSVCAWLYTPGSARPMFVIATLIHSSLLQ